MEKVRDSLHSSNVFFLYVALVYTSVLACKASYPVSNH